MQLWGGESVFPLGRVHLREPKEKKGSWGVWLQKIGLQAQQHRLMCVRAGYFVLSPWERQVQTRLQEFTSGQVEARDFCPDPIQGLFSLSLLFIARVLSAQSTQRSLHGFRSRGDRFSLVPTRAAVPASSFSFSRFSSSAEVGPLGLCTANTPLRDRSLVARAALEPLASDLVRAAAATAAAAADTGGVAAVAAAVPAVSGTAAVSVSKDDDSTAASAAAMLLDPRLVLYPRVAGSWRNKRAPGIPSSFPDFEAGRTGWECGRKGLWGL